MALDLPARDVCFAVFSQRRDARIDVAEWGRHAERFLATRVGLTEDKRYEADAPLHDVARVVLVPAGETGQACTRTCWGRPRTEDDLRAAESAPDAGAGLADLARRCPQIWLVEVTREDDLLSLRLAAILAGVLLGPILTPHGRALFGPKTARQRLAL